jgi:osmotically-inducible protein OsmY
MNKAMRALALVGVMATAAGCAPLLVGGAVVGGFVATDRRSVGIQLEDETIERRVDRALAKRFSDDTTSNIFVKSYNRRVLLTGEVASEADKAEAERIAVAQENVRVVANELYVGMVATTANRNHDTATSAKVRTALLREENVPTSALSVTVRRSVVYLMGRVSEPEGELAARTASRTDGVRQVVKLFDYLTTEEWEAIKSQSASQPASQRK